MTPVVRAFIAIEVSPDIHRRMEEAVAPLRAMLARLPVRWVAVDNIHLTLKFLGETSTSNISMLQSMLQNVAAGQAPFEINVGELGAFPSMNRPRVIWIGVQAPQELFNLQRRIEAETEHLGYPREQRAFSPHLTLGRISHNASPTEVRQIGEALAAHRVGGLGVMRVESVALYRSDLRPSGAVYTPLFVAKLSSLS